jgi:hypothetical protein
MMIQYNSNPSKIGPLMAIGLLSHLYVLIYWALSILIWPRRTQPALIHWTFSIIKYLGTLW